MSALFIPKTILPSSLVLKFIQQPKSCKTSQTSPVKKCEAVESLSCD